MAAPPGIPEELLGLWSNHRPSQLKSTNVVLAALQNGEQILHSIAEYYTHLARLESEMCKIVLMWP